MGRHDRHAKAKPPWRTGGEPGRPADRHERDADKPLLCVQCGAELGFDPEDEPDGEGPGRHICGECNRARNFDSDLQMLWSEGEL